MSAAARGGQRLGYLNQHAVGVAAGAARDLAVLTLHHQEPGELLAAPEPARPPRPPRPRRVLKISRTWPWKEAFLPAAAAVRLPEPA